MNFTTWITFVAAACLIAISPGSGAVLSMSHGLSYGVRRTSATILGLQAGLIVILLIAGAGIGSLLLASELAFNLVKTAGALYLIYLGLEQWRAKVGTGVAAGALDPQAAAGPQPSVKRRFLTGMLTNLTNPKGIIFMVAVLPQFITQSRPLLPQLAILCVTMCAIDLMVMHSYAALAASMQRYFRDAAAIRKQNRFFGGLLMAVGAGLFFVKRGSQA
ncbi:MAG: LysE family transporter [Burkholderiaceae bacterium]|nr:LysE family transporter [Burkholderiaceae bacterium]